jgi:valyl-tRNA synthetase
MTTPSDFNMLELVRQRPQPPGARYAGLYSWADLYGEETFLTDTPETQAPTAPAPRGEMAKAYDHTAVESRWYDWWERQGYFTPERDPNKTPFTITMPPPNVTGELHLGHALTTTIEDIMIRWKRMQGYATLWLPGFDHAGISGQYVVEKELAKRDLSRHDVGREQFLEHAWAWMRKYIPIISSQFRRLGASCDWTRARFTMDPGPARAVRTVFKHLYDKKLIYQGERIINWCPRCMTSLSDLEVENEETPGSLWTIRYPLAEGDGGITVATTRPETMLGDTAVAVHPDDARWRGLIGKQARLPIMDRLIPIIADEAVDPAFGTGAVKITPAHDPLDFEIGQRHHLPAINIMNLDSSLNENAGPYQGLKPLDAREQILERLSAEGLLLKTEPHTHMVPHCERCNTVLEPMISRQWFVDIQPLAAPAIAAAQDGRITFVPDRFQKVYMHWMENIRDWNISRQLWWGHRIPVWYCANGHQFASAADPETVTTCEICGSAEIRQDPDVLDTWFSSGLWPFTTLGWPDKTPDYNYFYPTQVMETGYDILFFWVARMIMQGLENTGQAPFSTVYLHGLVRDEIGRKMSKSIGNTVNPLEAADKYGTDALRFNLATGSTPGNDMKFSEARLEGMQRFANKLWNATRFIVFESPGGTRRVPEADSLRLELPPRERRTLADRWILARQHDLAADVQRLMDEYQFGEAGRLIYEFIWGEFCDWYLECAKGPLNGTDAQAKADTIAVLRWTLERSLRLLHPFMPFVTEELWQYLLGRPADRADLPPAEQSIMVRPWPRSEEAPADPTAERDFGLLMAIITAIRNARAEAIKDAPEGQKADLARRRIAAYLAAGAWAPLLEAQRDILIRLAHLDPANVIIGAEMPDATSTGRMTMLVVEDVAIALPMAGLVDLDAVKARLATEAAQAEAEIARIGALLANDQFVSKAKPAVVDAQREKLTAARDRLAVLRTRLASFE